MHTILAALLREQFIYVRMKCYALHSEFRTHLQDIAFCQSVRMPHGRIYFNFWFPCFATFATEDQEEQWYKEAESTTELSAQNGIFLYLHLFKKKKKKAKPWFS